MDRADRAYLAGLILGALALVALDLPRIWLDLVDRNDFAEHWVGAHALLDGGDPYDPARWPDLLAATGRRPSSVAYPYPPYVAVALVPFALLPLGPAAALWTVLGVGLAALALRALLRSAGVAPPAQLLIGMALLVSEASLITLAQGQLSFYLAAALAAAVAAQRSGRGELAGLAAWAFAVKPQVFLFAGWSVVATAVARRQRALLATLAAGAAAVLASVLLLPRVWSEWSAVLGPLVAAQPPRIATLLTLFGALLGEPGRVVAALLAVALTLVALRAAPRGDHPVWLALSVAAAPYAQRHDQVALLVPLALAVGAVTRDSERLALALCVAGVVLLVPVAALLYAVGVARDADPYGALVPLALFLLVLPFGPRR